MFEFIGIVVVVWLLFVVGKRFLMGAIQGTLVRACEHATSLGVPMDFAMEMSRHPEIVKRARKDLAKQSREFQMLDVYEQYGHAIAALYEEESRLAGVSAEVKNQVADFLKPQIDQLKIEGARIHINDITYVYLGALAACLSKNGINVQQIKDVVKAVFPEEEYSFGVENGYNIVSRSSDFSQKLNDILPVVESEIASQSGEFFVKYTRKANREMEEMFKPRPADYDPRKVSRSNFLDV